ncbi:hypothetical protein SH1V18_03620 [Vallitalea longa]|uniref:Uncharacterized protein n=1 Tax=Vallitalea longa TaxID=2936439 RepID=A0A9W5Y7I3_9FIRM|nr:hypothetical protein [Vallitalea longa]GKX27882.1 hypothetical protein SH1V18_03620 [Vallitalea longa]
MSCENSTCCGVGSSAIKGCKCSKQYGFTNKLLSFPNAGTYEIWNASGIKGLSGTIIVELELGVTSPGVIINGGIPIEVVRFFSMSVDLLESVAILTVSADELCVSIVANATNCC